jgi:hypothetical protein
MVTATASVFSNKHKRAQCLLAGQRSGIPQGYFRETNVKNHKKNSIHACGFPQ